MEGGVSQAATVTEGLHGYITLLPGLVLVVGIIAALQYPVTRKGFDALTKALEAKRAGEGIFNRRLRTHAAKKKNKKIEFKRGKLQD